LTRLSRLERGPGDEEAASTPLPENAFMTGQTLVVDGGGLLV
jgi:hypothetical protein